MAAEAWKTEVSKIFFFFFLSNFIQWKTLDWTFQTLRSLCLWSSRVLKCVNWLARETYREESHNNAAEHTKPYTNWSFHRSTCSFQQHMERTWRSPFHSQCCCLSHPCSPLNGLLWVLGKPPSPVWKATVCLRTCLRLRVCVCVFGVKEWESVVLTSRKPSSDAVAGHCKDCLDTAGWFWLIVTWDTQLSPAYMCTCGCMRVCVCVRNVQVLKESSLQFSSNAAVDRHLAVTAESVSVFLCVFCVIVSWVHWDLPYQHLPPMKLWQTNLFSAAHLCVVTFTGRLSAFPLSVCVLMRGRETAIDEDAADCKILANSH